MSKFALALALAIVVLLPLAASAQGVLIITSEPVRLPRPIPQPPQPPRATYALSELEISARLKDQLADVQVSQTFVNNGSGTIEAQFVFPLPYDGAVNEMTLLVNGKELPARLLSAQEARERYEEIVRRSRDPALLEWIGAGMFQTSVFPIPAGEQRTVSLHYNQLLRKERTLTDFLFPLSTARFTSRPIDKLSVRVTVEAAANLKSVYSPSHPVNVQRSGDRQATVTFEAQHSVPQQDFRLLFDAAASEIGATLLSYRPEGNEDGYFVLLASPDVKAADAGSALKTTSFVVDRSGSMSGVKIEQARDAARFVLNNLREGDLFNIISYDSQIDAFRPELERYNPESHQAALNYVAGLNAGGATNIHDALLRALGELKDDQRPRYVLFLTDGLPTAGETNESRLAQAVRTANRLGARLLTFGVGYDVNSRLLDRLARENHGLSEYVRPDESIETHVARVFQRMSSPVLTDVQLKISAGDGQEAGINRVYPGGSLDLFAGEQLVVVGRYRSAGDAQVRLTGKLNGSEKTYPFAGTLAAMRDDGRNAFIARLWAARRIGELIDELDLNGRNEELIRELVQLSTKHGILTPYTSFLADENVKPELVSVRNLERASGNLNALSEADGSFGFAQRGVKQLLKNADMAPAPAAALPTGNHPGVPEEFRARKDAETIGREAVLQAKTNTLYRRGKLIVTPETAALDLAKDQSQYQVIERFTPEYFRLVAANSPSDNELLARQNDDEELLVQLRGANYLIK